MFDTDKFIQCIENHSPIWEKASKEYSNRNLREKSWSAIGEMMVDMWNELTEEEKQEQIKEMKNKWRNIRDTFSKYINHGKSGDPASKKKKYVYADALSFLLQTVEKRTTSGNVNNETQEDEETQLSHEVDDSSQRYEDVPGTTQLTGPSKPISFRKPSSRKAHGVNVFQQKLLEKLDSRNVEEDPDKSFLISLLPDIKNLNDDEKLDFRFHTLQFFRDIRRKRTFPPSTPSNNLQNYMLQCFPTHQQYHTNNNYSFQNNRSFVSSPFTSPGSSQQSPYPNSPQESGSSEQFTIYSKNNM